MKLQIEEVKTTFSTQITTHNTIREAVVEVDLIEEEEEKKNPNTKFAQN